MGRVPFYAYPSSPYSFYSYPSPAEAYFDRHLTPPSSSAPRPSPTPRSVIDIPVCDSASSRASPRRPPSPLPPVAAPLSDPSSAATTIQSHFRGFCVRRHQPLLHLRTIAKARKQLEDLQADLDTPGFSLKLKENEKERLRFSETIMTILLRLDAIEGAMPEVRSQRKEATKMAIKLQDAIDAIMMHKNDTAALDLPEANQEGLAPSSELEQPHQEALHPEVGMVDMVQGEGSTTPANAAMDVNTLLENHPSSEHNAVEDPSRKKLNGNNIVDMEVAEDAPPSGIMEDVVGQTEGQFGGVETISQAQHVEAMCEAEQEMSDIMGEASGSDANHRDTVATHSGEKVGDGMDALHARNREELKQECAECFEVDEGACVDDMVDSGDGSAEKDTSNGAYRCIDDSLEGINQALELCPGTPTEEETSIDPSHCSDPIHMSLPMTTSLETLTDGNCFPDGPKETPASPQDSAILHQLSEDCRQLKSLVGKLLVQNKAQSNLMCALAERVEMLEHQQQQNRRHNQLKRKLKKGAAKRSVKHCKC